MNKTVLFHNEAFHESYYRIAHKSGLAIYVFPKKLSTYYALLGTKYGAIDHCFRIEGESNYTDVPAGIAHFLEHKLFEMENGPMADTRFAALGASSNAFTSADMTAYEFSCTNHFYESLAVLLDFVTHPYFTSQNVKKEQGIIRQEIAMCEDLPMRRLYYTILEALYQNDPIKIPVCGTQDSIQMITPHHLYTCYRAFYQLSNMTLVVCGDVDPQLVEEVADRLLKPQKSKQIERYFKAEPIGIVCKRKSIHMDISRPLFAIGIKDAFSDYGTPVATKRALLFHIVADWIFGPSSVFYEEAYNSGLLNQRFSASYEGYRNCGFFLLTGETDEPELAYQKINHAIQQMQQIPPSREDFHRVKKALYAEYIRDFDSSEEIANNLLSYSFMGVDLLEVGNMLQSIHYEDALIAMKELFQEDRISMAVVWPKQ